jgi:hypothetical protein
MQLPLAVEELEVIKVPPPITLSSSLYGSCVAGCDT